MLRRGNAYDNSAGSVGNGLLVGTFDVNNTSGVKQGTINCYIARNSANQVGTYNSYVPESGASSSLSGQIVIDWEVSLLRTDSSASGGGGGFTQAQIEEFALDRVAQALEAGDNASTVDINFQHSDPLNTISATIKPGSIVPVDIKKESAQSTRAASLSTWKELFDIPVGAPTVPQPVTLPVLFVTRQATDPADVVTIRDTRGYLNETHLVGTTFNLFKGGTASAQTALSGNPYTIKSRLTGGYKQATQRVQLDKNVTFTSSAAPVSTTMFNADVYYLVIGSRVAEEASNFHLYDDAESFVASGNTSVRGIAYNPVRNFISTIDGGTTKRHQAYLATGGGTPIAVYTQNLEGNPLFCAWDPDGRHLYVAETSSFKVYDFGASNSPTTLTISRVTSKEFSVATWFQAILGIEVTATQVWIMGKRYDGSTTVAIDKFSKTGTRSVNDTIDVSSTDAGVALANNLAGSKVYTIDNDGDMMLDFDLISYTRAAAIAAVGLPSYGARIKLPTTIVTDSRITVIQDRVYEFRGSNTIRQIDIKTSAVSAHSLGTVRPSDQGFTEFCSAGNFLYVVSHNNRTFYRSDQSQSSPTHTALTGALSSPNFTGSRFTILDNKLYQFVPVARGRLISYPLTGSVSGGYTAIDVANPTTVATNFLAGSVPTYNARFALDNDGTNLLIGVNDGSPTQTVANFELGLFTVASSTYSRLARLGSWQYGTGTSFYDRQRNIFHVARNGWTSTTAIAMDASRYNLTRRSTINSFPLGSRQATPTGLGFDESSDKLYVANNQRVNVYDKTVTGAVKTWLNDRLFNITTVTDRRTARGIEIIGNRLYLVSDQYVQIYSYPNMVNISSISMPSGIFYPHANFVWNGSFYIMQNKLREYSPTTGEWIGAEITLTGQNTSGYFWADTETNKLFSFNSSRQLITYPLPATGKITATTLASTVVSTEINIDSNRAFFERNGFLYSQYTQGTTFFSYRAYDKTTGARNSDEDFTIALDNSNNDRAYGHALSRNEDKLYITTNNSGPYVHGCVRAV